MAIIFGFHVSHTVSDPRKAVTFPPGYDNSDWNDPLCVDKSTRQIHFGDWDPEGIHADKVKWLYKESCTAYFKIIPDDDGHTCIISNEQIDDDMKPMQVDVKQMMLDMMVHI